MFRYIRNIAIVAIVFAFTAQVSNAQVTNSSTAQAEVKTALTLALAQTTSINFGVLSATTPGNIVLDANGVAGNANTGTTNTNVARFDLGGANSAITVSYDASVALNTSPSNSNPMIMTPEVVGSLTNTTAAQTGATGITSGTTITPTSSVYYIWVGGTIPTLSSQPAGSYSGTFHIAVSYN